MNKRAVLLIITALLLAGAYVFFFTDLFKSKEIQISFYRRRDRSGLPAFVLDQKYLISTIKVCRADDTNQFPHLFWHLVPETNAVPLKSLSYGQKVKGMQPYVKDMKAEVLQPEVDYRLILETDHGKAQKLFRVGPPAPLRR